MNQDAAQIVTLIVQSLEDAWNASSGPRFAAAFADDADFVDIRADYHRGKQAIQFGHQAILGSIYKGSQNKYTLLSARYLTPEVIIAQVGAVLRVPAGPLAGENRSVFSIVLRRGEGGSWPIQALHNTPAPPAMDAEEEKVREAIR
jgi:uncharacterized protein (TIGR02246 family)